MAMILLNIFSRDALQELKKGIWTPRGKFVDQFELDQNKEPEKWFIVVHQPKHPEICLQDGSFRIDLWSRKVALTAPFSVTSSLPNSSPPISQSNV
ncbi:MAG: hypothetical protein ACYCTV_05900 [Leptospirales bacterium]